MKQGCALTMILVLDRTLCLIHRHHVFEMGSAWRNVVLDDIKDCFILVLRIQYEPRNARGGGLWRGFIWISFTGILSNAAFGGVVPWRWACHNAILFPTRWKNSECYFLFGSIKCDQTDMFVQLFHCCFGNIKWFKCICSCVMIVCVGSGSGPVHLISPGLHSQIKYRIR